MVKVNTEARRTIASSLFATPAPTSRRTPTSWSVGEKCVACLQLAIFSLERELDTRGKRLGTDFDGFFKMNTGRVCLDGIASKDVHVATVPEIRNFITKAKSEAAAEAKTAAG